MHKFIFPAVVLASALILSGETALAAGSDEWVKPATGLIDMLNSGLVKTGAGLLGVGIIIYGLITSLSGEPNWRRLGGMFFGGFCVFFGPKILTTLLQAVQ